jgi:CO/xanthine dehydrogenase Mo-binding subunit
MATKINMPPSAVEAEPPSYRVIGTRPIRPDGVEKVTGRARYGADIRLPGMLYGGVLRSPHAHARIRSIDTRRAEALPGVKAVVTAADLPDPADTIGDPGAADVDLRYQRGNLLAREKVLYQGHAVAAVAAASAQVAEAALALIDVTYEALPPVLDVREAMRDDAPILLEDLRTDELGQARGGPTNVASHIQHQRGNLEQGFRDAAVIVEREFDTATVHQGYIEPHTATALYQSDGHLTIWCSTQGAFGVRGQVGAVLRLPVSRIKVIPLEIGGGFGGKLSIYLEPLAALLSKKSGFRPVKMTMSRGEVFAATGPTAASHIRVKIGADRAGRITAAQAELAYAAGAFPGSPVGSGAGVIFAPYRIPNVQIDGYDVLVNRPKSAAYRAPGATNAAFAAETAIDELCERLGMDPLEFRLLNGAREGDRRPDGPVYPRIGFLETVAAARNTAHYSTPLVGPNRGRGVAAGFWFNWGGRSSVAASVNPDGTVSLVEGSVDIGGSRAAIAMQLAETLGIPVEDIRPEVVDTDAVGYNDMTGGSRTTFATGWAAYEVGQRIKQQLIARAAQLWEVRPEAVRFQDGIFSSGDQRLSFKELAARLDEAGDQIVASATVHPRGEGAGFGVHIVDVEVDRETGKVEILRYTAVQDAGTAIHPSYVEGQIQGGAAQGVGWALYEGYDYDAAGQLRNANFLDYHMPTCLDLPPIEAVIVEVPNPGHPYGVRGVGEVPIIPPPAALANAIARAIGVRMGVLPMTPARILAALHRQAGQGE